MATLKEKAKAKMDAYIKAKKKKKRLSGKIPKPIRKYRKVKKKVKKAISGAYKKVKKGVKAVGKELISPDDTPKKLWGESRPKEKVPEGRLMKEQKGMDDVPLSRRLRKIEEESAKNKPYNFYTNPTGYHKKKK